MKTCLSSRITHASGGGYSLQQVPSFNRRVRMNIKFGIIFSCLGSLLCNKFEKCGSLRSDSSSNLFAFQGSADEDDIMAPWLAAVGIYTQEIFKDFQVSCSGVIVTRGIIVTAAHCFVAYIEANKTELIPTHVRVGANRIDSRFSEDRKIKEYIALCTQNTRTPNFTLISPLLNLKRTSSSPPGSPQFASQKLH